MRTALRPPLVFGEFFTEPAHGAVEVMQVEALDPVIRPPAAGGAREIDALLREVQSMSRSLRKRNADLFDVAHDIAEFVP